jgi:hypothetical protein
MKFRDDTTDKGYSIEYLTNDANRWMGIVCVPGGKLLGMWSADGRPMMNEKLGNLIGLAPKVYAKSRHAVMQGYISRALKENDQRETCLGYLEVSYYDNGTISVEVDAAILFNNRK